MKKRLLKLGMILGSIFIMFILTKGNDLLQLPNTTQASSAPSFSLYEKVYLNDKVFTIVNNGSTLKLLSDNATQTNVTVWQANNGLNNSIIGYATTFGTLGNPIIQGKISIPSKADLSLVTSGTTINASIPKLSTDWWLRDTPATNRTSFVDSDNRLDKNQTITKAKNVSGVCGVENVVETGIKPSENETDQQLVITTEGTGTVSVNNTIDGKLMYNEKIALYSDIQCTSKVVDTILSESTVNVPIVNNVPNTTPSNAIPSAETVIVRHLYNLSLLQYEAASRYTGTLYNICMKLAGDDGTNGAGFKVSSDKNGTQKVAKAFKFVIPNNPTTFKYDITIVGVDLKKETPCPIQSREAGTSSLRPMINFNSANIALANTQKRNFTPGISMSGTFPVSDTGSNKPYLTLKRGGDVGLDGNADGVMGTNNGFIYQTKYPEDHILTIPIRHSGSVEGKRYISAVANIGGVEKYGVLKEVSGSATGLLDTVQIDLRTLTDNPTSLTSFTISLFDENSGIGNTAYMGEMQTFTVEFMNDQSIEFDAISDPTITYGTHKEITASLTSNLATQSSSDIKFSIKNNADVQIQSQSYDPKTGKAKAKLAVINPNGTVTIAINKAGDANTKAAEEKTVTLTLNKANLTIKPEKPTKIYSVGEPMPTLISIGNSPNITIPPTIVPQLVNVDGTATQPNDANGIITEVGKWKLIYPSDIDTLLTTTITDRYNVTFEDWDDDNTLIFETEMSDIPDSWISITPQPNAKGWNLDTVTLAPSDDAIAKGFTFIELVNDADTVLESGATITHSNETTVSGVTLKVQLKKGDYTSNTVTTRTIYIDKTKPSASVSIDKENDWASNKKVEITATDSLSGIQSVSVVRDGTAYIPTVNGNVYSFDADTNGTYTITVIDQAGNETTLSSVISKIDASEISIKATPETLSKDAPKQKITIDYDAGDSGVKSLSVYYKATESEEFTLLDNTLLDNLLDQSSGSIDWYAEMNGYFQFELINNANGKVLSDEIHITQVNPPVPVTQVVAYEKNNKSNSYVCNTWVNHDVTLEITNANTDVSDPVSWEISEDDGKTWKALTSTTFDVTTSENTSMTKAYLLKAKTDSADEQTPKSFTVKIDKQKPDQPEVVDSDKYTDTDWYAKDVTLTINTTQDDSGSTLYVCEGDQSICQSDPTKWVVNSGTMSFTGNGSHELYFKAIDGAGNESDPTDAVYVNINTSQPVINIKIQNDPVKELLKKATLGFFFNDTVSIDIDVTYGGSGQTGKVYYIIESDQTKPEPKTDDTRWTLGTSTSITPDTKGKIYVKAVSDAGVISYDNSVLEVFADVTAPVITLPSDMSTWTNDSKIEVEVTDGLSGIDPKTLKVKEDSETAKAFTLQNNKAEITLTKNGSYPVIISASDYSGNDTSETMQVMLDTQGPTISEPSFDVSGYAQEKTITFSVSDSLSNVDEVSVKNSTGSSLTVTDNEDGTYSFTINENDTYTITSSDKAGNITTKEIKEEQIDTEGPRIDNIQINDETEIRPSKTITFEVTDALSGIDEVSVTVSVDGETKTINVNIPTSGDTYSFNAKENATYTITAKDQAGNISTETVTVSNIDTSGIRIINVSDTGTWVKDQMTVTFEVSSSIPLADDTPAVTFNGAAVPVQFNGTIYSFVAAENGTYTIDVSDEAGQSDQETLNISRIDSLAPVIEDISSNITSTEYREPQIISFSIHDYHDSAKTSEGSGIKNGYPTLSIILNGTKTNIPLTQAASDPNKYTFLATYNGDYVLEVQDQVEHDVVKETITVDHILSDDMISPIVVKAYNDTTLIASGTWVRNSIRFEISGGLDDSMLEKYQFAVTDGTKPSETDWHDVNKGNKEHEITGNIKGDVYWFRVVPVVNQSLISQPFTVNLDSIPPASLSVQKRSIHTDPISRFINLLSFGNWLKEAQEVTFEAEDNFTDREDITYMYYEERNSEKGNWKRYSEPLIYNDTNITLYVKAIDLAGNETAELPDELKIDSVPPVINGAKDQSEYKYYYLPRYLSVTDQGSGLAKTTYKKDQGSAVDFNNEVSLKETGTYEIYASDLADNETTITFKIVPMPELDDIDGSDESKTIIDQIKQEFEEVKDKLDANETGNYDKWVDDATDQWDSLRKNQLIHKDTTTKIEGIGDTTFDPKTELVVEEVKETNIPDLPHELIKGYDVYLRKNGNKVQANGKIKVYLPYDGTEEIILYEIDKDSKIKEISYTQENGYIVFETDALSSYALTLKEKPVDPDDPTPTPKPDPKPEPEPTPDPKPNPIDPDPQPKPDPEEPKDDTINIDTDGDNKPDINIDINCDGKLSNETDLNIDTNNDNIPDINIDTTGDTKPNYNIDIDGDGKPNVNIGPVVWNTDKCSTTSCGKPYCTSTYYKPYLNIDTDDDGLPDINLDLDKDNEPDLNIDLNFDHIPDIDIDSKGTGIANINVDVNHDGIADINIVRLNQWHPNLDVAGKIAYDTMTDIKPMYNVDTDGDGKPDENLADNSDNKLLLGDPVSTNTKPSVQGSYVNNPSSTTKGGVGGAKTSDDMNWLTWWLMLGVSIISFTFTIHIKRKLRS